jgi:prepilin-type N-terminal cleavage/methylation domain-containing protein
MRQNKGPTSHHSKVKDAGFTLIELLVVIAIIGILSSIVLASLNTARAKGADAAIKSDLSNIRPQAEIFYDDNGHYGVDVTDEDCATPDSLFADANVASAIAHAGSVSGNSTPTCYADDGVAGLGDFAMTWAISVPLKTDALISWCIDSTGFSGEGDADHDVDTYVASCQ